MSDGVEVTKGITLHGSMRFFALLLVLVLGLAACNGDNGTDDTDTDTDAELPDDTGDDVGLGTDDTDDPDDNGTDTAQAGTTGGGVFDSVMSRGSVVCGVNDAVPGFGFTDEAGEVLRVRHRLLPRARRSAVRRPRGGRLPSPDGRPALHRLAVR
jgi:hypothetical protein